jgi:predicted component of viral defense system (DUF524 family)
MNIKFRLFSKSGEEIDEKQPLFDQSSYRIEFERELIEEEISYIDTNYTSILSSSYGVFYTLALRNYVGEINLFGQVYEVQSKKWNKKQVEYLYREVSRQAAALPFYSLSVAHQQFEKNLNNRFLIRYHQWVLLRDEMYNSSVLKNAWESISKEPHTLMISEYERKESWNVSSVDERSWHRFLREGNVVALHENHRLKSKAMSKILSRNGTSYFPTAIDESVKRITYDTKENRFIKNMLHEFLDLVEWMEAYLHLQKKQRAIHQLDEVIRVNKILKTDIQNKLGTPWMKEVGPFNNFLGNSTIMQRKQGYRQWFVFYQTFIQGIGYPITEEEFENRIETKSIDKIYEMWCFFEIKKAINRVIGKAEKELIFHSDPNVGTYLGGNPKLTYFYEDEPLSLYYNRTFSISESYSLEFRPDISIHWRGKWYHFDAKYKQTDSYKNEDIHKMHVYKDAIQHTRAVIALYPAFEEIRDKFFEDIDFEKGSVDGGIGVLHLKIGTENTILDSIIKYILNKNNVDQKAFLWE